MDSPYARYHKHGAEGVVSGVARVGDASEADPPIIPRKVHRKELLINNFLAKSLSCSLCSDIITDAQSSGCGEGHSFCAACLAGRFGQLDTAQCPTCSKEIQKDRVSVNVQLQTLVNDLGVNCPSNLSYNCVSSEYEAVPGGCGWKERFEDLPAHLAECTHQTVLCSGSANGCPVSVWRWGLPAHMKSCTFSCECECGASVAVRELEMHKLLSCTRTEVRCPHEKLGCGAKLRRPEMAAHLKACDFQRMRPAFLALEAKHAAEVAKLKREYEVTVAGERAYFEREMQRLRAQLLLASQAEDQRGQPKLKPSKGAIAMKAKALGLSTAEELQAQAQFAQQMKGKGKGKRKRDPGDGTVVVLDGSGPSWGPSAQANGGGGAAPIAPKPVDVSQFLQLPQNSLFQFDQIQGGKEPSSAPQQSQNENPSTTLQVPAPSEPSLSAQASTTPAVSQPVPHPPPSVPTDSQSQPPILQNGTPAAISSSWPPPGVTIHTIQPAPPTVPPKEKARAKARADPPASLERPVFKLPASQKPGYKKCPWTESCTKILPQNASHCPSCGKRGPKPVAPLPPLLEQKCGGCGTMNPRSFVTCIQCNAYLPREYSSNKCSKCGRGNNGNARTCGACGAELRAKRVAQYSGNTCPKCRTQ
ncbi:hypothetical protein KFL_000680140 [Klebsormidium nitens]|uniref:RING-type domain-containing protein n=1 Tax=Klebsormidium nitens TaxID=105231 RepID=A0A0U9HLE1_KLENI|nr:hypothetical protein KFL_000680140 [Klebsormidium nitens]|eukprot:GAQ80998.1 hypothetical protein KFL_000680140 [Klebsormidium nitens]